TLGTNLIADSTLGDDEILGTTVIDSVNTGSNGTFFATVQFDNTSHQYAYIRFFNETNALTGMIYWGTSDVFALTQVIFGVVTIQADPGGSLQTTNYNNFVIIPEPSTVNLFLVMAGMMFAMRVSMRRKINRGKSNE
ncbi:MAG: PEP-CTERM sorting domain-containing protein, partial [Kiritimatiellae bacterium]|nr:PEP-CTERM sorting domain-containing protein [Kiritimatiellia bacterium]